MGCIVILCSYSFCILPKFKSFSNTVPNIFKKYLFIFYIRVLNIFYL